MTTDETAVPAPPPAEPRELRLTFGQVAYLRRLVQHHKENLNHITFGWALLPMCDETIAALTAALPPGVKL